MRRHHVHQSSQLESALGVGSLVSIYVVRPGVNMLPVHVHREALQNTIPRPFDRLP